MTFKELKLAVEAITGTNTNTGSRLNRGQLELAKKINRTKSDLIDVLDGIFELPSTCLEIRAVGWNNRKLELFEDDILPEYSSGIPAFWKQDGENIKLIPAASGKAELIYKPRPVAMVLETDNPELADCEDVIIAYAIWKNYIDGEDGEEAEFWETEYYKRRQEWLELTQPKYKRKHRIRAGVYK